MSLDDPLTIGSDPESRIRRIQWAYHRLPASSIHWLATEALRARAEEARLKELLQSIAERFGDLPLEGIR